MTLKVQLFIWRLLKGIIPTSLNRISRFVDIDSVCAQCGDPIESTEHALHDCPGLQECWYMAHFPVDLHDESVSLDVWLLQMVQGLTKENKELLATILWVASFARNKLVFRNAHVQGSRIHDIVVNHLNDYRAAMVRKLNVAARLNHNRWCPPDLGVFKLNTDAAFRAGVGMGVGTVMRDKMGWVMWCYCAEEIVVPESVKRAKSLFFSDVMIEMDSQGVYFALTNVRDDLFYFGGII